MEKTTGTREKLVDAARSLFAEKGFDRATTAEIAREAGLSEGTIYRHFKSKRELLMECVVPVLQKIVDTTEHYHPREDNLRQLTIELLAMRLQLFQEHHQTFRILFRELLSSREMINYYMDFIFSQEQKLSGIMSQIEKLGQIKRTRNYLVFGMGQVMSLWMYINLSEWGKEDGEEFSSEMLNEILNVSHETLLSDLADYILYGISGSPESGK